MASFKINDDEWNALLDESPELFKIYCGLRKEMNYETGIVGAAPKRINEQAIKEIISVPSSSGRHRYKEKSSDQITHNHVQYWIKRLRILGLIVPRKDKGNFVFECILADTVESIQNRSQRGVNNDTTDESTKKSRSRSNKINDFYSDESTEETTENLQNAKRSQLPQDSGTGIINNNIYEDIILCNSSPELHPEETISESTSAKPDRTPYQKIVELYHDLCPSNPKILDLTAKRKKHIKVRWQQYSDFRMWKATFEKVAASDFLSGRKIQKNGRVWVANLLWIVNEENWVKIWENRYDY